MCKKDAEKGQALIELLLTIALASLLLATLGMGLITSREAFARPGKTIEANMLLQKEIEALRSVKETNWNTFSNPGTYHIEQSSSGWVVASGTSSNGEFTRGFSVKNTCRQDSTSLLISCNDPQAVDDPSTKEITALVSWSFLGTQSVSSTFYLTRYFGNQTWLQTTRSDFQMGSHENTVDVGTGGGAVQLDQVGGTQEFVDDYDIDTDYTFDPNYIEVLGGFAQLKAQGSTVSGQTINSGFNSNANGWSFTPFGQSVGQTGRYQPSGGNPGGYIDIYFPSQKNRISGGYWSQAFTTTINNPSATLTFNWGVPAYQAAPDSFHLYAFVDTTPGPPTITENVWSSGNITATTPWSSTVTVDVSSKITTPGTYYLKVAAYIDYSKNNRGPFIAAYDNVLLQWSGTVGSYPTNSPTVYRNTSFSTSSISSWSSFSETAQTNGGSIRYQLSDDDGATWRYYNGSAWIVATAPTNYNSAAEINNNISSFPATNNKINVKAFLISNGSQFVQLDRINIGYQGTSIGMFTSSTFDANDLVAFNRLFWTEDKPAGTTISLQVATNNDNSTWNFVGPDGTDDTYFTGGVGVIPLSIVSGRYARYRIEFTSSGVNSPRVFDVTINYSP